MVVHMLKNKMKCENVDIITQEGSSLEKSFRKPPREFGVKTWWHWVNGNISADGITRDLEAMKEVGVNGFQIFQVGTGVPKGKVDYGSPEHLQLLQHAANEASRLGLEFVMHNCPGWSSSGGPWMTPELSMKQLVWSETFIAGGKLVNITLPRPYANLGYYQDAFVLAFPSLMGEKRPLNELLNQVISSNGVVDIRLLTDGDPSTWVEVHPASPGQPAFLQLEFYEPFEARSIVVTGTSLAAGPSFFRPPLQVSLEASDDGALFRKVCDIKIFWTFGQRINVPATANFPTVRAKYFRLVSPGAFQIFDIQLLWAARIADWPVKTNLTGLVGLPSAEPMPLTETVEDPEGSAIDPNSVLDITRCMDGQGRLIWQAPPGDWTILRIGYTTTGTVNHPAPEGGEGLECDKYSREAFEFHYNNFFGKLLDKLAPLSAKGLAGALIDSYEVGFQNWTPKFPLEFEKRRGYDLRKYLPAMTGRVVGSAEISERFLWDVRRTQADLMADNYYGCLTDICHKYGMKSYAEPYSFGSGSGGENVGGAPFDEMQIGSRVDVPMGEFWVARDDGHERSVKLAASIAHVYGKPLVGAESFTGEPSASSWQEHPYLMKSLGDFMFTRGLNLIVFHTYAHQPHPTAVPGMTMGPFGCFFNRNTTWWSKGKTWLEYLTRCQYMLQQGTFVADMLYFVGEGAPLTVPHESRLNPPLPKGYDFDFVNSEAILTRLKIEDGRIVTPEGTNYRVLALGDRKKITLELLRKIRDMVEQGMCLVGSKPEGSPSLVGFPESEEEVRHIADEVWGDLDGKNLTERAFGKGHVFWGQPLHKVLEKLGILPDFEFTARSPDALINYIHRRVGDVDVYFVANRRRRSEELVCNFRVQGKHPELWNPENGEITPMPIYEILDGRVRLPLRLGPNASVFVVFRSPPLARSLHKVNKDGKTVLRTELFSVPAPGLYPDVTNNFTISVWVKPEVNASLPIGQQFFPGLSGACWVFYPPEGEGVYGKGHTTCGLAAGRNGIVVYERGRGEPKAVLGVPMPLEGWTHLAIVYREGTPYLYVNGKLVREGQRSDGVVHPGIREPYQGVSNITQPAYSIGDMSDPELFTEALEEDRIRELAAIGMPKTEEPPSLELVGDQKAEFLIWQNGSYTLLDSQEETLTLQITGITQPIDIVGPWRVSFPPNMGAPREVILPELMSLHKHIEDGVKYFSGTATYHKQIDIPTNFKEDGKRLYLDLGRVETIAEIRLNGKYLGILWKPPYRVDITDAARTGINDLEISVTNVWVNRLIGDEQLPPENEYGAPWDFGQMSDVIRKLPDWYVQGKPKPSGDRVTFTTWRLHNKDSPLLESGLIGPVRLLTAVRRTVGY